MKKRPAIGITTSYENGKIFMNESYFNAVWNAGGMPVYLPRTLGDAAKFAQETDGLLLSGGGDVEPSRFGEAKLCDNVISNAGRDEFEFAILKEFIALKKPVLGICRGMQLISVFLGGSLFQDIPGHWQSEPANEGTHKAFSSEVFAEIIGAKELCVNSFHHQAVKAVPDTLSIEAVSEDGIIEAVSLKNYPYLYAVQWHPEGMTDSGKSAGKLFSSFIKACADAKKSHE